MCPSSNPGCEDDGKCYKRSGHSYSWRSLSCGSCTSSHSSSSPSSSSSGGGSGGGSLKALLAGLKGKSDVSCDSVCSAAGGEYRGMGMSSEGEVATWNCQCGSKGKVAVACTGSPFIECCKDKCAGSDCVNSAKGWQCPASGGCPGGGCAGDWKDWVAAHNIYRCMHDVPPVVWDKDVYQSAYNHFHNQAAMEHSDCYDVPAPAGPAGENLFKGSGSYNAMDAVSSWYEEINNCGGFPGCTSSSGMTGHFTALIWQGDKEIGCLGNSHNLFACRYKALDFKSCNTPNYGDAKDKRQNVYPRVKSYSACKAKVQACGLPVSEPKSAGALDSTTGLSLISDRFELPGEAEQGKNMMIPVVAFSVAAAALMAVLLVRRMRAPDYARATSLIDLEETELSSAE